MPPYFPPIKRHPISSCASCLSLVKNAIALSLVKEGWRMAHRATMIA
jgi:hypothetical protein